MDYPADIDAREIVDSRAAAAACRLLLKSCADATNQKDVDKDELLAACNFARQALGIDPIFRHGN